MSETVTNDVDGQLEDLRKRTAVLEDHSREMKKPWYKNVSTLIAVVAFLFSFGTTVVSYRRSAEQDTHNLRVELRGILQRLAQLPKENLEAFFKYQSDPNSYATISSFVNQENLILSRQADDTITRLPTSEVSSTDYMAVGIALQASRNFESAMKNFQKSLVSANTLDDELAALKSLGALELTQGRTGDARAHFQKAVDIFGTKYASYDQFTKTYVTTYTEIGWASAEASAGNMKEALEHIAKAERTAGQLPPGPGNDAVRAQVMQSRTQLSAFLAPPAGSSLLTPPAVAIPGPLPVPLPKQK
jgi:tetratricopeptide (TPR) repeat protein